MGRWGILALGLGMAFLVAGSILGVGAVSTAGYVAIVIAFTLLIYTTLPAFN